MQNKMAGVNSRFEMSIKSTLNGILLQLSRSSVVDITTPLLFEIEVPSG